jgi:ketosteroid isomerase-like protein
MDKAAEIQELVDRESRAYETCDADLMLTIFHPDMVWVWPPHSKAYDPMEWVLRMGRFHPDRWRAYLQKFFDEYEVVRNSRITRKIFVSPEGDGGFAVVDIDTLWRKRDGSGELPNTGRACKIYTLMPDGWKMIHQPGTMHYPVEAR